mmetsp:Transcript_17560/g.49002  ORF Transcript_17560/g.49002 Transcript_17560/m.49002 type:complete len:252 (-) Transcript_17560:442-1197(-)
MAVTMYLQHSNNPTGLGLTGAACIPRVHSGHGHSFKRSTGCLGPQQRRVGGDYSRRPPRDELHRVTILLTSRTAVQPIRYRWFQEAAVWRSHCGIAPTVQETDPPSASLLAGAANVAVRAGVNLNQLAHLDEKWHLDHCPCLKRRWFASTSLSVALHARVTFCDFQVHLVWQIHTNNFAFPGDNIHSHPLLQVLCPCLVPWNAQLFIGLHIHENTRVALWVRVLTFPLLNPCRFQRLSCPECLLNSVPSDV